ncbi:MAG: hypothetical protein ACRDT0_00730, partial [Pseudonocardiaceae bacterium]
MRLRSQTSWLAGCMAEDVAWHSLAQRYRHSREQGVATARTIAQRTDVHVGAVLELVSVAAARDGTVGSVSRIRELRPA